MDHISSVNEACQTNMCRNSQCSCRRATGPTKCQWSFLNCKKMFTSKSAAPIFTLRQTSCCHCDFFQYVTIEGELKGKSNSLQIRHKKGKEDRSYSYTGKESTDFTVVTASLPAEMLYSDHHFNITSLSRGLKVNVYLYLLV